MKKLNINCSKCYKHLYVEQLDGVQLVDNYVYNSEKELDIKSKINLKTSESKVGQNYAKHALILLKWIEEETKGKEKDNNTDELRNNLT